MNSRVYVVGIITFAQTEIIRILNCINNSIGTGFSYNIATGNKKYFRQGQYFDIFHYPSLDRLTVSGLNFYIYYFKYIR